MSDPVENIETSSIDEPQVVEHPEISSDREKPETSDSENESSGSEENKAEYQTLKSIPDSDRYVLSINERPKYYVKTAEEADICMWHVARCLCKLDPDYTTRYVRVGRNALNIERECNWYVISYPEIVHRLRYHKVEGVRLEMVEEKSE